MPPIKKKLSGTLLAVLSLLLSSIACQRFARPASQPAVLQPLASMETSVPLSADAASPTPTYPLSPPLTREKGAPVYTPTPDFPHALPTPRSEEEAYTVRAGDTLRSIATRYGISYQMIVDANKITNPDLIDVGLELVIPPPNPQVTRPDFKIIPDSELVLGPYSIFFDIDEKIDEYDGYLSTYSEEMDDGSILTAAEIVERVAKEFSVNPRLLVALIEHQSGWLREAEPSEEKINTPLGMMAEFREGLYAQLSFAANELNRGYYLWRVGGITNWALADGEIVLPSPIVNAGTAGVQNFFAQLLGRQAWEETVGPDGFITTYTALFGYPFDYAYEPLTPANLIQPSFQLPFEIGDVWSFTGGPHGGWGSGSGWAALDFAPPGDALGCVESDAWVTAIADGLILRAKDGAVVQDLDGDGLEQTGWTILYMHIDKKGRVKAGETVRAGERIGHPSCEGGFSTGTHVHIARRYNGEWVSADGSIPFVMDGWVSQGAVVEYDGYLVRNERTIEAWNGRAPGNEIKR